MASYTHVQFISWEIYTGPNRGPFPWDPDPTKSPGQSYSGLGNASDNRLDVAGQILDIEARCSFTFEAVKAALPNVDKKPTTLKVFMAPEFLYRGKGGAYIHDLINGWNGPTPAEFAVSGQDNFRGLFGNLDFFPLSYPDWLFVFGTAISASFPAIETNRGWVLDATKMGEIYNTALIQHGGPSVHHGGPSGAYASRKRYISSIDFIKSTYKAKGFTLPGALGEGVPGVGPADRLDLEPNESNREGSATFTINGVNDKDGQPIMFGLEVCLDHAISTGKNPKPNQWGRIRTADKWVKIQLVPSGGMQLNPDSIRLLPPDGPTPHSYAFNCDGLTTLGNQWGAHTQIWNGANGRSPVPLENQLINANYGQQVNKTTLVEVSSQSDYARDIGIDATKLWDLGSGYVRVMQPMPL